MTRWSHTMEGCWCVGKYNTQATLLRRRGYVATNHHQPFCLPSLGVPPTGSVAIGPSLVQHSSHTTETVRRAQQPPGRLRMEAGATLPLRSLRSMDSAIGPEVVVGLVAQPDL